jgi:hypothetical protein
MFYVLEDLGFGSYAFVNLSLEYIVMLDESCLVGCRRGGGAVLG